MARIPESEIERLKAEVSLVRLIEARGIVLTKQGKDLAGRCPFHRDDTPSLVVTPGKNLYHCFGCNAAGGPIDWVMKLDGVSFRHAVELLRDGVPLATDPETAAPPRTRSTVRKLEAPLPADADDAAALQRVVAFYHETLKQSPEALAYLQARGLQHPELIEHFQLGYANRTLAYRLPEKNRQAGAAMREQLQRVGILRESGHEHFNGSLVVPVFDASGHVLELYGRKLLDNLRAGTPKHLYLPGPHAGVFNAAALSASKEIILCEALIDALTFWCAGYRNVTAAYGVHGFTDEMLAAFGQHGIERVLIAFDRDDAGHQAAEALAEKLGAAGIECFRVLFPKGMDANEYALRVQPATKSLGLVLRNAEWMGKGKAPDRAIDSDAVMEAPHASEEAVSRDDLLAAAGAVAVVVAEGAAPADADVLPASPMPEAPTTPIPGHTVAGDEMRLVLADRFYRVRGLPTKPAPEQLKVNLLVKPADAATTTPASGYHVDTVDLYSARQRAVFGKQASVELGTSEEAIKRDLGQLILALEGWQEQARVQASQAQQPATLSDAERAAALDLLRDPQLMTRVLTDFARCGVVGEAVNKQVAYLAAVSRKLDKPLAVMVQSSSAAGKSSLMDAVLRFVPPEERLQYSAMTGQSLFYLGEKDLKHKILAISEEEGASNASYALKLLQSEGEVSIASTGKNALTGNLETQEYRVEGPVMLFSTTTAIDLDEELLNRCLVLSVDESREQTQAIHAAQRSRRTLDGLRAGEDKAWLTQLHQNAQRLLRPLRVVNPYAEQLTFLSDKTRMRRDHEKYLALIDVIALLHQHQREIKRESWHGAVIEYVEVSVADIALANTLAHEVLGRTLDELPPQTRKLLQLVTAWVRAEAPRQGGTPAELRFTRKQVREVTGWGNTQLKVHLGRLEDMEYLAVHRQAFGKGIAYELRFDGPTDSAAPHLMGLIDVAALHGYDDEKSGSAREKSGHGRPEVGAKSAHGRCTETAENTGKNSVRNDIDPAMPENARPGKPNGKSHRNRDASSLAAAVA